MWFYADLSKCGLRTVYWCIKSCFSHLLPGKSCDHTEEHISRAFKIKYSYILNTWASIHNLKICWWSWECWEYWSQPQQWLGKRWGTRWAGHQSITGLPTHRDNNHLESPNNLIACLWAAEGSPHMYRENMRTQVHPAVGKQCKPLHHHTAPPQHLVSL